MMIRASNEYPRWGGNVGNMYKQVHTGNRTLGEWPGTATLDVDIPPNWKPCEEKYGAASGDLDIERVSSFPKGRRLCDRGAGLNLTTYKVYKARYGPF